jgi:hypothetical protein
LVITGTPWPSHADLASAAYAFPNRIWIESRLVDLKKSLNTTTAVIINIWISLEDNWPYPLSGGSLYMAAPI